MRDPSELVALLEQDYEVARQNDTQNIRDTMLAGLNWSSTYWVECALNWIEQGAPIDDEMVLRLEEISVDKRYTQKARHRAFTFAVQWKRKNTR